MRRATIRATTVFILIFAADAQARAQARPSDSPARRTDAQVSHSETTNADEEFELNIDQRRINESDFHAETAVSTDGARGLRINVGVALRASDIDVLLRNVRGRVRFRATLDPVLRLLDSRRAAPPPSQAPPPPP